MKRIIIIIGIVMLILNLLVGLIFSYYKPFNNGINSGVIILNSLFVYSLWVARLKTAFRISLSFLFCIFAVIEYFIALFMSESWKDNINLVFILVMLVSQIILFIISYYVSKNS